MNSSLIPRRLTQPKTLLVIVIAVVVLTFISVSGGKKSSGNIGTAVKPGSFSGESRRSAGDSSKNNGPIPTEDGNIDYCEILREPVLLNQRSHWDNFAENPNGRLPTPDRSEGDIGNWFGTLAYFSSIETGDLENPHRFFTSCELACAQNPECVSFLYERYMTEIPNHKYIDKHRDRCYLNKRFQYGTERLPKLDNEKPGPGEIWNGRSWTAGWHRDRAEKWLIEEKGCTRPTKKPSRREQRENEEREQARRQEEEEEAAAAARAKMDASNQEKTDAAAAVANQAAAAGTTAEEPLGAEMLG